MKKFLYTLLFVTILMSVFSISAFASIEDESTTFMNNPCRIASSFTIDDTGNAVVKVSYTGEEDLITGATIKTKIQKRFLFFFWQDVTEWVDEVAGSYYTNSHSITVDSGTYKAIVEYTIRGTGGDPDVVTDEIERTY